MSPAADVSGNTLAAYEKVIATLPDVTRKGAGTPYTSINGHMFSFITQEGAVALRLPEAAREAFLKKFKTTLCEQYGRVMKEYVVVPDRLLKQTAQLSKHFTASYEYVSSLKPKPTTRKKKKKKK